MQRAVGKRARTLGGIGGGRSTHKGECQPASRQSGWIDGGWSCGGKRRKSNMRRIEDWVKREASKLLPRVADFRRVESYKEKNGSWLSRFLIGGHQPALISHHFSFFSFSFLFCFSYLKVGSEPEQPAKCTELSRAMRSLNAQHDRMQYCLATEGLSSWNRPFRHR